MKMMSKCIFVITLVTMLTGCGLFGETRIIYEDDLKPLPPTVEPANLSTIKWISDPNTIIEIAERQLDNEMLQPMMCINPIYYRRLKENMLEITRFTLQTEANLRYYTDRRNNSQD